MVAVSRQEAERFLASPPAGIRMFLIYGNDSGGVTERARLVEKVALQRGGGETVLRFGSDELSVDPGRIIDEARSASLFGGEPVIGLRVLDGRHNVLGALNPLLETPPEASWLVVEAGDLPASSALRKAFETCRQAACVATYQAEGADLSSQIRAAAAEFKLTIEPGALELLSETLGGDRLATRSELEKLFLYVGDESPVSIDHVTAIVGETAEVRSDEIVDAALLGDNEGLEAGLDGMRAEGGSFSGLATQAIRHLIQLQTFRSALDSGGNASAIVERARPPVFFRRRAAVEAEIKRWAVPDLAEARRRLDDAAALSRRQSALETAAISEALHGLCLRARRLRQSAR